MPGSIGSGCATSAPGVPSPIDAVDPEAARVAERDQDMCGGNVGRHMDRPGRQRDRLAEPRQRARSRVDRERRDVMIAAGKTADPGGAVARRGIEDRPRGVRPAVMHIGRQCDGAAAGQGRGLDIDIVLRQLRPDARIKRDAVGGHGGLLPLLSRDTLPRRPRRFHMPARRHRLDNAREIRRIAGASIPRHAKSRATAGGRVSAVPLLRNSANRRLVTGSAAFASEAHRKNSNRDGNRRGVDSTAGNPML